MTDETLRHFEDFLARRNLRLTGQRRLIVDAFLKHKGHVGAEDLYHAVRKIAPGIGYTTVYRTLKLLAEAGLASSKNFGNGYARFESTRRQEHHDHLICTACGKIVEFVNEQIELLQRSVAERHGFRVTEHTLDIYGVCRDCQTERG